MSQSDTSFSSSYILDIQGQSPGLYKLFTQICSVYPVPDSSKHESIISTLQDGLRRTSESFPWLAGNVIYEDACDGNTGTFRIACTSSATIPLVVQDLRNDPSAPTMDDLRGANFPMTMLDERLISPCMTIQLPGSTTGLAVKNAPVFAVQANFIIGGLMLTLVGQHNVMDMTGQNHIMNWLSKACHGQPFSAEELSVGNMDRTAVIPLLDDFVDLESEIAHQLVKPQQKNSEAPSKQFSSTWAYITFSASSLLALKSWATETMTVSTGFVSTDDSVSAFIWRCVARARKARLHLDGKSLFARALDVRTSVGAPSAYTGVLTNMAYSTEKIGVLDTQPLGEIASLLRKQLDPVGIGRNTRALATFNSRTTDKTRTSITANVNASSDIMLSSWAKIDCFNVDFNLGLGNPEAVRRPAFVPVESLMYILPRSPNGELPVAVCLRDEDWECLRRDEEFVKYATYIG